MLRGDPKPLFPAGIHSTSLPDGYPKNCSALIATSLILCRIHERASVTENGV